MSLYGVIPAFVTPFGPTGEVEVEKLQRYLDWLIGRGIHGLFACGTNGEGPAMTVAQRKRVAAASVEVAAGRVPVVVMTGAVSTAETIELTAHAAEIGATGAGIVTPWYFPLDEAAMEAHFAAVAEAVPGLELFLYNIPANAKNEISPALAARLAERYPQVRGLKDSSKGLDNLKAFVAALPGRTIIAGTDALLYDGLAAGAKGVVSAVADCFPEAMVAIYEAYMAGRLEEAKQLQAHANKLRDALKMGPYIHPYKLALHWRGIDVGGMRQPLRPCTAEEAQTIRSALEGLGVL